MAVCREMNRAPEFSDNLVENITTQIDAQVAQMIAFGMTEVEANSMIDEG